MNDKNQGIFAPQISNRQVDAQIHEWVKTVRYLHDGGVNRSEYDD